MAALQKAREMWLLKRSGSLVLGSPSQTTDNEDPTPSPSAPPLSSSPTATAPSYPVSGGSAYDTSNTTAASIPPSSAVSYGNLSLSPSSSVAEVGGVSRPALTLSSVLSEGASNSVGDRSQYADEMERTILVKNVHPRTTRAQLEALFVVPHGVRNVKWYPKGRTKNALVEFMASGEGPQGLVIENLVNVDGNWLSIEPSIICIREAVKHEWEIENRRARDAQMAIRKLQSAQIPTPSTPTPAQTTPTTVTSTEALATPVAMPEESLDYWKQRALNAETTLQAKEVSISVLERELSNLRVRLAMMQRGQQYITQPNITSSPSVAPAPTSTPAPTPLVSSLGATPVVTPPVQTNLLSAAAERWRDALKARKANEKAAQEAAIEQAEREKKLMSRTYLCPICFTDVKMSELYTLDGCFHRYCIPCMRDFCTTNINSGTTLLRCPDPTCKGTVSPSEVKQIVDEELYQKYEKFSLHSALDSMPDVKWCPKPDCGNAMIVSGGRMARCTNPRCRFTFCTHCKEEWHIDLSCEQWQQWKQENTEADSKFTEWARTHSKPCPRCHCAIEKNGGCNHMTCRSCSHQFCWLCLGNYDGNHFGEGGPCEGMQFT
ncbi:E3 ubiquitin-protein ligase RNF14 [Pelomyxa schiedti]|nr:E3 ubiquitin-protein ligase RNF14 [Pelomyxa schiedti]